MLNWHLSFSLKILLLLLSDGFKLQSNNLQLFGVSAVDPRLPSDWDDVPGGQSELRDIASTAEASVGLRQSDLLHAPYAPTGTAMPYTLFPPDSRELTQQLPQRNGAPAVRSHLESVWPTRGLHDNIRTVLTDIQNSERWSHDPSADRQLPPDVQPNSTFHVARPKPGSPFQHPDDHLFSRSPHPFNPPSDGMSEYVLNPVLRNTLNSGRPTPPKKTIVGRCHDRCHTCGKTITPQSTGELAGSRDLTVCFPYEKLGPAENHNFPQNVEWAWRTPGPSHRTSGPFHESFSISSDRLHSMTVQPPSQAAPLNFKASEYCRPNSIDTMAGMSDFSRNKYVHQAKLNSDTEALNVGRAEASTGERNSRHNMPRNFWTESINERKSKRNPENKEKLKFGHDERVTSKSQDTKAVKSTSITSPEPASFSMRDIFQKSAKEKKEKLPIEAPTEGRIPEKLPKISKVNILPKESSELNKVKNQFSRSIKVKSRKFDFKNELNASDENEPIHGYGSEIEFPKTNQNNQKFGKKKSKKAMPQQKNESFDCISPNKANEKGRGLIRWGKVKFLGNNSKFETSVKFLKALPKMLLRKVPIPQLSSSSFKFKLFQPIFSWKDIILYFPNGIMRLKSIILPKMWSTKGSASKLKETKSKGGSEEDKNLMAPNFGEQLPVKFYPNLKMKEKKSDHGLKIGKRTGRNIKKNQSVSDFPEEMKVTHTPKGNLQEIDESLVNEDKINELRKEMGPSYAQVYIHENPEATEKEIDHLVVLGRFLKADHAKKGVLIEMDQNEAQYDYFFHLLERQMRSGRIFGKQLKWLMTYVGNSELMRRLIACKRQMNQPEIKKRLKKINSKCFFNLNMDDFRKIESYLKLNEDWPVFHGNLSQFIGFRKIMKFKDISKAVEYVLGKEEFDSRVKMFEAMNSRYYPHDWIKKDELIHLYRQGYNIIHMILVGDTLQFGLKTMLLFDKVEGIASPPMVYIILKYCWGEYDKGSSWSTSAEKEWFLANKKWGIFYNERMNYLKDFLKHINFSSDQLTWATLGYLSKNIETWWNLADSLEWAEENLNPTIMTKVGNLLNLKKDRNYVPDRLDLINHSNSQVESFKGENEKISKWFENSSYSPYNERSMWENDLEKFPMALKIIMSDVKHWLKIFFDTRDVLAMDQFHPDFVGRFFLTFGENSS